MWLGKDFTFLFSLLHYTIVRHGACRVRSWCEVQYVSGTDADVTSRHSVITYNTPTNVCTCCQPVCLRRFSSDIWRQRWSSDCAVHATWRAARCSCTRFSLHVIEMASFIQAVCMKRGGVGEMMLKTDKEGKQRVKFCQFYAAVQHQHKLTPDRSEWVVSM